MKQFDEKSEYDDVFRSMNKKVNIAEKDQTEVLYHINNEMDKNNQIQRKNSKWKYYLALSTAALLVMVLVIPLLSNILLNTTGNMDKNESIKQILNEFGYDQIIYQKDVENGVVVIYDPDIKSDQDAASSDLSAIFIKKSILGWQATNDRGGYTSSVKEDISSQYLAKSNSQSPFPMMYGEINNAEITQIKVINEETNEEYLAETISGEEKQIWFTFLDENIEGTYEIHGLSNTGEVIFSKSVNNDVTDADSVQQPNVSMDIKNNVLTLISSNLH
ncbi:hypothetical protein [Radiobacillus sp. PE A8.2]|uniref:hypothetical protein n=1 Tax=Radiobacillus sp. PE A8.2 TaxID=3380349 RepID=UPI00388F0622